MDHNVMEAFVETLKSAGIMSAVTPALTSLGRGAVSLAGRGATATGSGRLASGLGGLVSKGVQASGGVAKFQRNVGLGIAGVGTLGAAGAAHKAMT